VFRRDLCWAALAAGDAGEALEVLSGALAIRGLVRPTFAAAVRQREASSPTGLPLPRRNVAVPHADAAHVIAPAIAVCSLARPVPFGEMGNPGRRIPVSFIALLALPDHHSAQQHLVTLLGRFQDGGFVESLCAARDGEALFGLLSGDGSVP
jgi:PTS system galactitol-specific IIA component